MRIDPDGVEVKILDRAARFEGARVLELGCGDGRLTARYGDRAAEVLAVDADRDAIRAARAGNRREHVRFRVADAASMRVPRRRFDVALFSWSL